ncbi:domain found in IF2B/IF5-domain-containing protein [Catenaria anguillulae PL171]|uniref:Domain found in IF2B/IF5-domain-containing protein n=1 Tax=Catenaria anguillulae PL171 TaxID=765915 RepID=A0A1Y2HNY4_9FUNG|nr:domain found in IF2B/IF5-domain-containing protein [Catenaria anguillulae PL171]
MSRINIGGDKDDAFYRYKMDPIQCKIEGSGNGIKTVLPNLTEVARSLHRPPMYPCKFFGTELGAQTKHDAKNDRYIINGAHDAQRLQELVGTFIEKFVLCGGCGNPETDLKIINGMIERHCLACGHVTPIDMRHKLTTFILNNPPEGAVVGAIGKKGRGKKGKVTKSKEQTPKGSDDEADSGDELHKQIMAEAKTLGDSRLKDDDWSVDLDEAAQKKRQAELLKGVEKLGLVDEEKKGKKKSKSKKAAAASDDDDDLENDPLDSLATYVQTKPKATVADILAEVKEAGIAAHLATHVLAQVLVRPDSIGADLKARAAVFKKLNAGNARAHKYFLGGLERMVAEADATKKVPVMLKNVYELDLADEAAILAWGKKVTKKWTGSKAKAQAVREAAKPFLDWLEEASDEEEESDEDDEE